MQDIFGDKILHVYTILLKFVFQGITDKLDITRRKASEICLRPPSTFSPTRSPDNAQKPQIWQIAAKGSP